MSIVLVVAPHPDDETLGCGGTLLRHIAEGDQVHWLIMSTISTGSDFSQEKVESRKIEIKQVANKYGFSSFYQADFISTQLDTYPLSSLINVASKYISEIEPEIIYLPYRNDVHSDHVTVFDAVSSCTKSFRYPYIKKVRAYETLSETEFSIDHTDSGFKSNCWVDITQTLDKKIEIMRLYKGEMGVHPFPRSEKNIQALATLRGARAGVEAAEGFINLMERVL
jgi:N-acetylglucosamine malate deacetylase 1